MKKKELPLLLYKEPIIVYKDSKSIITFEYFNVKKYHYEMFEVDQCFSSGDTTEIEHQRKKVYRALKRGYGPDIDLVEGEFITHFVSMADINIVTHLSWLELVFCSIYRWNGHSSVKVAGTIGFILWFEIMQITSIIALLINREEVAAIGFAVGFGGMFISGFLGLFFETSLNERYYTYYVKLPSDFRDFVVRVIFTVAVEAFIGGLYFFNKV